MGTGSLEGIHSVKWIIIQFCWWEMDCYKVSLCGERDRYNYIINQCEMHRYKILLYRKGILSSIMLWQTYAYLFRFGH